MSNLLTIDEITSVTAYEITNNYALKFRLSKR